MLASVHACLSAGTGESQPGVPSWADSCALEEGGRKSPSCWGVQLSCFCKVPGERWCLLLEKDDASRDSKNSENRCALSSPLKVFFFWCTWGKPKESKPPQDTIGICEWLAKSRQGRERCSGGEEWAVISTDWEFHSAWPKRSCMKRWSGGMLWMWEEDKHSTTSVIGLGDAEGECLRSLAHGGQWHNGSVVFVKMSPLLAHSPMQSTLVNTCPRGASSWTKFWGPDWFWPVKVKLVCE